MKQLPLLVICLLLSIAIKAQVTTPSNNTIPAFPQYVGWSGLTPTVKHLDIKNNFANRNINFFTNNTAVNGSSVQVMTILGNAGATQGFMGVNVAAPVQRVDVGGDINLRTNIFTRNANNDGYRINNQTVLQVKNSDNLFVGFGAGASWTNALAGISENTFVGNNSGFSNNGGFHNAFFGFNSGRLNVTGDNNTFLGFGAGFNNTSNNNTFVGTASGTTNTTGEFNTFIGTLSGGSNTSGRFNTYLGCYTVEAGSPSIADHNTHIGFEAGQFTTSGDRNVLTGSLAGWSLTIGAQNVISGMQAGFGTKDGSNNVFIGWESALENVSGMRNTFMGSESGRNQLGNFCTFIGFQAGYDVTTVHS